jgi:hypothetical protein
VTDLNGTEAGPTGIDALLHELKRQVELHAEKKRHHLEAALAAEGFKRDPHCVQAKMAAQFESLYRAQLEVIYRAQLEVKVDKVNAAGLSTPSDILAEDDDILWDKQLDGQLPATEPDRTEQGDEP